MSRQGKLPRSGIRRSPRGKLLSMLLVLCMIFAMMPVSVMADAPDIETYDIWVGGVQVTSENLNGDNWHYTPAMGDTPQTLILSGAAIQGAPIDEADEENSYGIYAMGDLDLVLIGTSFVNGSSEDNMAVNSTGIYVCSDDTGVANLTIFGLGNLSASGGNAISSSYGISLEGHLNIYTDTSDDGGIVIAEGGDAQDVSVGVLLSGDAADLVVESDAAMLAGSGESKDSIGILLQGVDSELVVHGELGAIGGKAAYASYGILSSGGDISVNDNAFVEVISSRDSIVSVGIFSGTTNINGGYLYSSGDTAVEMSYGIFSDIIMTGGYLEASSSDASESQAMITKPTFHIDESSNPYQVRAGESAESSDVYDIASVDVPYGSSRYIMIEPRTGYDIYVGGQEVTSANRNDVLGDGTVSFTPFTMSGTDNILVLNEASIYDSYTVEEGPNAGNNYGIYTSGSLKILLVGDSNIAIGSPAEGNDSIGIYSTGNVAIDGIGDLVVTGGAPGPNGDSYGVLLDNGDLAVEGGGLIASGAPAVGSNSASYGIRVHGSLSLYGRGRITATGDNADRISAGVYLNEAPEGNPSNLIIDRGCRLTASGGTSEDSYGIYFEDTSSQMSVYGGNVTATGGSATNESAGTYGSSFLINGGKVETLGSNAGSSSIGIAGTELLLNGGKLEASSGIASVSKAISAPIIFDDYYAHRNNAGINGAEAVYMSDEQLTTGLDGYKYVEIESLFAVQIGNEYYDTLQDAVDAAVEEDIIDLLNDIELSETVKIADDNIYNFTINLNGHTINSGSQYAIEHEGLCTLTIIDKDQDGVVTSTNGEGTIHLEGGSLEIKGGTITNNSSSPLGGVAIHSCGEGDVIISGGTVSSNGYQGSAIFHDGRGDVNVYGGTVSASGTEAYAIYNIIENGDGGNINITGGTVSASGTDSRAILNNTNGEVVVAGGTVSGSGEGAHAIFDINDGKVIVYGGMVNATGEGSVGIKVLDVQNAKISIPTGTLVIKGEGMAMNAAPDLSEYTRVIVRASENYSGTPTTAYHPDQITAYKYLAFTSKSSGGGGGGSSSGNNTGTEPTSGSTEPTKAEIKVSGTVDSNGNVTANITDKNVNDALNKAFEDAKKNGNEANGISLVLNVTASGTATGTVTVNLPKSVQDTIISKKVSSVIVVLNNSDISVSMDLATLQEINKQAKSDVNVSINRRNSNTLTGIARNVIGSRPVFDLNINYGNGNRVENFGSGNVTVTIPYTLGINENAENICAIHVNKNGQVHWLSDSVYDKAEKILRFRTNHFSIYGIGYKQNSNVFKDIAGHWAKEDIECVVNYGLFSGTSASTFSPNTAMTRGMFVTVLGRLANADVSSHKYSSFADVKGDAYYMGYIEWASTNGIVKGMGDGKFAPDQPISREQMAAIMNNYAKIMDVELSNLQEEKAFADSTKISAYAKDAVKQMQMSGILSGKNGNLFDPQGTATRAEVSAVLHRFVEMDHSGDDH